MAESDLYLLGCLYGRIPSVRFDSEHVLCSVLFSEIFKLAITSSLELFSNLQARGVNWYGGYGCSSMCMSMIRGIKLCFLMHGLPLGLVVAAAVCGHNVSLYFQ